MALCMVRHLVLFKNIAAFGCSLIDTNFTFEVFLYYGSFLYFKCHSLQFEEMQLFFIVKSCSPQYTIVS